MLRQFPSRKLLKEILSRTRGTKILLGNRQPLQYSLQQSVVARDYWLSHPVGRNQMPRYLSEAIIALRENFSPLYTLIIARRDAFVRREL